MNITFLIGNGFDVGLGLKTQYKDFYEYFIEKSEKNNMIRKQLIEAKQGGAYDTWADLEKALGVYTKEISETQSDEFIQSKIDMDILLLDYLEKEQAKIQFDEETMKKITIDALAYIREGNTAVEKLRISNTLRKYSMEHYLYSGISFNYTNCFSQFFEATKKLRPIIQTHKTGNIVLNEKILEIEHIHGTLTDGEMILGVNDESQIQNSQLADIPRIRRMLIKPELNTSLGQNKIERAIKTINESKIICIYGMSLGDTDRMWWELLGKWLLNNLDAVLMIFKYDLDYKGRHAVEKIESWEATKEYFMLQAGISQDKKDKLKEQIVVYVNKNIFECRKDILREEEVG